MAISLLPSVYLQRWSKNANSFFSFLYQCEFPMKIKEIIRSTCASSENTLSIFIVLLDSVIGFGGVIIFGLTEHGEVFPPVFKCKNSTYRAFLPSIEFG